MRLLRPVPALVVLLGCGSSRAEPAECEAAAPDAPACLGIGEPEAPAPTETVTSVTGTALATCSRDPRTGYFRDGSCRTGPRDRGVHVVCAEVDPDFLDYTSGQGNDLSSPVPGSGFPGLRPGDRWCLCAARWAEARDAGKAPPVVLEATHAAALKTIPLTDLTEHAR